MPDELGGITINRGVRVHVVDDLYACAVCDRVRHIPISVPVPIVVVTVGVDAVVPRVRRIVGLNGGIIVITVDELVPAVLVAVEVVPVVPVVQGVGLRAIAVRVDSVVAGVRSAGVDIRLSKPLVRPGGPGRVLVDIVQLGAIHAIIAKTSVMTRVKSCIETVPILVEVICTIAVRVHAVIPGVLCSRMDLVGARLLKPGPVHHHKVTSCTRIVPAVLPRRAVRLLVKGGVKTIPIPIKVVGAIAILVDAVVPDLVRLRKNVRVEIVAVLTTGNPVAIQVGKLPIDAAHGSPEQSEDHPKRRSAKAAHRPSKTVGPVAKHPGRLPVAIARDQLLSQTRRPPLSLHLYRRSESSP